MYIYGLCFFEIYKYLLRVSCVTKLCIGPDDKSFMKVVV